MTTFHAVSSNEHVHPAFAAVLTAVVQPTPTPEQEYRKALKAFDWFYSMSDEMKWVNAGASQHAQLRAMQKSIDPSGAIWNEYRPDHPYAPQAQIA
jgi:hypothetical protein